MADAVDQFSSAKPLLGQLPNWVADPFEQRRLASYQLYESIYWSVPQTFKLAARGTEDNPIYVPSGRVVVETLHRYLANSMTIVEDPNYGTDQDRILAKQVMTDLARRERIYSKFNANKRYGIMRGDWMFHLYADPLRAAGARVSVFALDPSSVFAVTTPENVEEVLGYHIVDQYTDPVDGKVYIRRLTYMKQTRMGGPSPIEVSDALFKVDDWGGPGMDPEVEPEKVLRPTSLLPSPIDDLPIYHIPNFSEPGGLWGSSEMRGLERIMAGVNQGISDEELALALEGLGVYTTDAGTPVDEDGNEVPWRVAPGRVIELPDGKSMARLKGIDDVKPFQDHLKYLGDWINEAAGLSDIARGRVDVQVAESGVALMIEMAPLLAKVVEKEQVVTDAMTQLLFNLPKWYVAYEGTAFNSLMEVTRWIPEYGDKLPRNRAGEVDELLKIAAVSPAIVPMSWVRDQLRELGYDIPNEDVVRTEIAEEAAVAQDAFGARVANELSGLGSLQTQG